MENVKIGDEGCKLILNGGPKGRVRPPAMSTFKFLKNKDEKTEKKSLKNLEENLKKLTVALQCLQEGDFLDQNKGDIKHGLSDYKVDGIGPVASILFPSLALFIGLCLPTKNAVKTAKQSLVNTSTTKSYFPKMRDYCKKYNKGQSIDLADVSYYLKAWRFIAISWGDLSASIENGSCGTFRRSPKNDVFFYGQNLYNLQCDNDDIWVKGFESEDWKILYLSLIHI